MQLNPQPLHLIDDMKKNKLINLVVLLALMFYILELKQRIHIMLFSESSISSFSADTLGHTLLSLAQ